MTAQRSDARGPKEPQREVPPSDPGENQEAPDIEADRSVPERPLSAVMHDPARDVSEAGAPGYVDATAAELDAEGRHLTVHLQVSEDMPRSMPGVTTALGVAVFLLHPDGERTSLLAHTTQDGWLLKVEREGRQHDSTGSATPGGDIMVIRVPLSELHSDSVVRWFGAISFVRDAGTTEQSTAYDRFPDEGEATI